MMRQSLKSVLDVGIRESASDVHIMSGLRPSIRVNSELSELSNFDVVSADDVIAFLREIGGPYVVEMLNNRREVDFSYLHGQTRVRCNAYLSVMGPAVAIRIVGAVRDFGALNLPSILEYFALKRQGFFLVVGPVGNGKTTTLAAMVDVINRNRRVRVLTIEDPVEYVFENKSSVIVQRDVGVNTTDFNSALRASFREDFDVIVVGEMRDYETISTAVTAAETGHLILSTLHTNDAVQTIDRIINSFPADGQKQIRMQLSDVLLGVFSIRLLPSLKGGRVPAYELLMNNSAVANLIREEKTHEIYRVLETSSGEGMVTLNKSLAELVRRGDVSYEVAASYSPDVELLNREL